MTKQKITVKLVHLHLNPALNAIVKKVVHKGSFSSIEDWIFVQNKFDLEMLYTDHPEYRKIVGSGGKEKRLTTPIFSQLGVFSDETEKSNRP